MSRSLQGRKLHVGDRVSLESRGEFVFGRVIEIRGHYTMIKFNPPYGGTVDYSPTQLKQWHVKKLHK